MANRNFFSELKRRNVYKVAVAYAVVGWLVIQVSSTVLPTFHAPEWVVQTLVVLVALGFPIALVIAWAFELTPEGIKRTQDVDLPPRHSGGGAWVYIAFAGAALSIGLFFLGRYATDRRSDDSAPAKSIAVLPFANQSGDPAQEYFSDGLSEELINGLGQIHGLRVIGRNSSFHFKGKSDDSRAVGQVLGVAHLLEGSVRKAGDRVRISVELVHAANGSQRWSQTYDRELKDIFAVQEEIARSVADQLRITLLGGEVAASARPSNGSLEAYNAYLQGEQNRSWNIEGITKAIAFFDEAIRLDPRYAEAYALKSLAWSQIGNLRGVKGTEAFQQARIAAKAALAIKPDLPRARSAMAWFYIIADWNLAAAEAVLEGSDQKTPTISNQLANVRAFQGRTDEAIQLQKQAVAFDPVFAVYRRNLASRLTSAGRLAEAETELRKAVESLQPQASGLHFELVVMAVLRGQPEVAWREAQSETNGVFRDLAIALAHAARADRAEADAALNVLTEAHGEDFPFRIAGVYAYRKEPDKAFEWLDRAYALHDPRLITLLADPLLQSYQSDPRFAALCKKMGLPIPK
jgi:TolB-like protein/Flp pilus assembly protein TadD